DLAASGERAAKTAWQSVLAEAPLACGDVVRANEVLGLAFAFVAETGERSYEPELHRLRGGCVLAGAAPPATENAAERFERAAALAAEVGATLFELRAMTSLFRIRQQTTRERLVQLVARFGAEDASADSRAARASLAGEVAPAEASSSVPRSRCP